MLKQLKRIKVRKPSFNKRNAIFLNLFELNILEAMRKRTATTSSIRSSKYMMLKLLRKEEEISKEERFSGEEVTLLETYMFIPLKDLNAAKGDKARFKKS